MMIFVGQEFDHQLEYGIDLDSAISIQIRYTKPGALSTTNLSAFRVGQTDVIHHVFTTEELDTSGLWKANAWVDYGNGKIIPGETVEFMVYNLGESL